MTNARTVLVPAGRVVRWFENFGTRHGTTSSVVSSGCLSVSAADGATALAALPFGARYDGPADATAFAHAVDAPARWGVLLVRKGGFAVATVAGLAVAESKVGQRHVQGRTKAGGQSQQRFARRRDNQARQAYEAAAEHAARILTGRLTALVCGGAPVRRRRRPLRPAAGAPGRRTGGAVARRARPAPVGARPGRPRRRLRRHRGHRPMTDEPLATWPLFGLRLRCGGTTLRPVRERDLAHLAAIQPDDYEHDPRVEVLPWMDVRQHRTRLVHQEYWRSMGTWSPASWCLGFAVEHEGAVVGVQSIEADDFPSLRTVDSGSWLVPGVRGRGIGVAMRTAVLGLAFDHLGARAAITSAVRDNHASLGVSRHLGYRDNGVSLTASGSGVVELVHLRLTAEEWRASGRGADVDVDGLEPCLRWFGVAPADE